MEIRIELISEKKLLGKNLKMCLSENKTPELWRSFMLERKTIRNNVNNDLISLQIYDDFKSLTPNTVFEKWALAEVSDFDNIPETMKPYILKGGLYAVFIHKGSSSDFQKTFNFIFKEWFPNSGYNLDNREHFEVLGHKYKNNDPSSEEEIWIPIKIKE